MTHMTRDSCFVSSTLSQQLEAAAANCVEASAHLGSAIGCLRRVPEASSREENHRRVERAMGSRPLRSVWAWRSTLAHSFRSASVN